MSDPRTTSDPREKLAGAGAVAADTTSIAPPETVDYRSVDGRREVGPTMWAKAARAQNFVLDLAVGTDDFTLEWDDTIGYVVIALDDDGSVDVSAGEGTVSLNGRGIVTVPAGHSTVVGRGGGRLARMFPAASAQAADLAANSASYAEPHPRVALVEPVKGEVAELKSFAVADFPNEGGRFGTIFRTETLMINFLDDSPGARDTEKMSPHHHDDFEQGSFTTSGEWAHHIRTPWTKQMSKWREDEAIAVGGETLTVIPPPTVHTSRSVGSGLNRMIDLFSPSRGDFEDQGWVLNAEDYA